MWKKIIAAVALSVIVTGCSSSIDYNYVTADDIEKVELDLPSLQKYNEKYESTVDKGLYKLHYESDLPKSKANVVLHLGDLDYPISSYRFTHLSSADTVPKYISATADYTTALQLDITVNYEDINNFSVSVGDSTLDQWDVEPINEPTYSDEELKARLMTEFDTSGDSYTIGAVDIYKCTMYDTNENYGSFRCVSNPLIEGMTYSKDYLSVTSGLKEGKLDYLSMINGHVCYVGASEYFCYTTEASYYILKYRLGYTELASRYVEMNPSLDANRVDSLVVSSFKGDVLVDEDEDFLYMNKLDYSNNSELYDVTCITQKELPSVTLVVHSPVRYAYVFDRFTGSVVGDSSWHISERSAIYEYTTLYTMRNCYGLAICSSEQKSGNIINFPDDTTYYKDMWDSAEFIYVDSELPLNIARTDTGFTVVYLKTKDINLYSLDVIPITESIEDIPSYEVAAAVRRYIDNEHNFRN